MAKTKAELFKEAQRSELVPEDSSADDFSVAQLEALLGGNVAAWKGSVSSERPLVAPDGHPNLTQEDIDSRA